MRRLLVFLAFLAAAAPAQAQTTIIRTNSDWYCNQSISSLAYNGLPLRVTLNFTRPYADAAPYGLARFGPTASATTTAPQPTSSSPSRATAGWAAATTPSGSRTTCLAPATW